MLNILNLHCTKLLKFQKLIFSKWISYSIKTITPEHLPLSLSTQRHDDNGHRYQQASQWLPKAIALLVAELRHGLEWGPPCRDGILTFFFFLPHNIWWHLLPDEKATTSLAQYSLDFWQQSYDAQVLHTRELHQYLNSRTRGMQFSHRLITDHKTKAKNLEFLLWLSSNKPD